MQSKLVIILLCGGLLAACTVNHTPRLEVAKDNFQQQNYRTAYLQLKTLANKDEPEAHYALGYLYYYGLGVVEDAHQARRYFQMAADKGHNKAAQALEMLNRPR